MSKLSIIIGIALVILAVAFYVASGSASVTALIPAFIGLPILLLGFLAAKESLRKHAIHAALFFALLGLIGSLPGLGDFFIMLSGNTVDRPLASIEMFITFILCGLLIILGIRSFIAARRQR